MQTVWSNLLTRIPAAKHDVLGIVTKNGTEIAIQCVMSLDEDFLVIKGRLAGSQDGGRIFFLPYANISYLAFQKEMRDTEFQEMFGPPSEVAPAPEEAAPPADLASPSGKAPPIKSAVLERFRSRSTPGISGIGPIPGYRPADG